MEVFITPSRRPGTPARERAGVDPGGLGNLGELGISHSSDGRGTLMWRSTWECGPKSKRQNLTRVKNSKSGGTPTIVGVAGKEHSVAVLDAPGCGTRIMGHSQ